MITSGSSLICTARSSRKASPSPSPCMGPRGLTSTTGGSLPPKHLRTRLRNRTGSSSLGTIIVPSDDDPVRFRRRVLKCFGGSDPPVVDVSPLGPMHGEGLGDAFLDDLAVQMRELPEVIIVLEDLHHLSNAALISDLARLSELLPRNVHLVLSSRADLPIAWSRQRMRLDVMEIRQVDLAFDDTDSSELLERITGQSFSAESVTALVNRTEGWAAGLQLAGMTPRLH